MNRHDFQLIAQLRIREAKVLLDNRFYSGAYYLSGYAVECAFKACIAKQVRRFDFPDKRTVDKSYSHDLNNLLTLSGVTSQWVLDLESNPAFYRNWAIVKDWKVESRYDISISEKNARDLYAAVTERTNGVLSWLKKRW